MKTIEIQEPTRLLMELGFINGLISSISKDVPEFEELNKIINQLI